MPFELAPLSAIPVFRDKGLSAIRVSGIRAIGPLRQRRQQLALHDFLSANCKISAYLHAMDELPPDVGGMLRGDGSGMQRGHSDVGVVA